MKGRLLITLSLTLLGWSAEGHRSRPAKTQISGRGPFYLGQQRKPWAPLIQTAINFTDISSIRSTFQLRTLDPEGMLFYGDTNDGQDWFLLNLKEGQSEMQIEKGEVQISMKGGPKLNDGKWHLLELSNIGRFVTLLVDGKMRLELSIGSDEEVVYSGLLRMALGGILINSHRLLQQLQPELDGCLQEGNWLNLTNSWDMDVEELWPCYENIKPGSYFPGTGFAVYSASTLGPETKEGRSRIELWGDFNQMHGTILSIKAPGQKLILALVASDNREEVTLTFGVDQVDLSGDLRKLEIVFQRDVVQVLRNEDPTVVESLPITLESQAAYLSAWREGHFAIGGLLGDTAGEGEDYVGSNYLIGCLEKIQIDGFDLDLDLAVKHGSVSSHSCPVLSM